MYKYADSPFLMLIPVLVQEGEASNERKYGQGPLISPFKVRVSLLLATCDSQLPRDEIPSRWQVLSQCSVEFLAGFMPFTLPSLSLLTEFQQNLGSGLNAMLVMRLFLHVRPCPPPNLLEADAVSCCEGSRPTKGSGTGPRLPFCSLVQH